jgi:hypothetical protein
MRRSPWPSVKASKSRSRRWSGGTGERLRPTAPQLGLGSTASASSTGWRPSLALRRATNPKQVPVFIGGRKREACTVVSGVELLAS